MKLIKYIFEATFIYTLFFLIKVLGLNMGRNISSFLFSKIGFFFRPKKLVRKNILRVFPNYSDKEIKNLTKSMWSNYGCVFAEYIFISEFRDGKLSSNIEIEGKEILDEIKKTNKQVVFVSGHFSNFELMAMCLEKSGVKLSAIYRPLNNIFLNKIMERIRKRYICKHQIKKGISGIKELIKLKKHNFSTALMIDQRVSEGILSNFFEEAAYTTTIPAQLIKKFNIPIVPVYIERIKDLKFKIVINEPITFDE